LAAQDPSNAGWQRDLAVAHARVGDVLQAQGKLEEAQAAFGEYLAISRRLAAQDPSNAGWQRDLAVAYLRIARLESELKSHTAALPFYEEASGIFGGLVKTAPRFAEWAQEKESVDSELERCRAKVQTRQ
jgi:tetratricopeptide (TPR) repeat protein